jgi:hypothetical protein
MIVEINGPQLSYFAGRLDREQYLRTAVAYYPSIRYLHENAPRDALILSLNNAARAYAPSPGRFHFISAHWGIRPAVDAARLKMARIDYDYAVVPTMMAPRFAEMISLHYPLQERYSDPHYTVFAIGKPGGDS